MSLKERARAGEHHRPGGFRNILGPSGNRSLLEMFRWQISPNPYRHEYADERVREINIDWRAVEQHPASVTLISHACVLIRDHGFNILVDPVLYGLTPLIRNFTPIRTSLKEMPQPDQILVTHGHYDHLDLRSLRRFRKRAQIITPLGYEKLLRCIGIRSHVELDWYDQHTTYDRQITLLPCRHWTMRNPLIGPNRALWGSFLIRLSSGFTIYISGDSGYFNELSEIGDEFHIDLAIINLSAYEPRWFMQESHINPAEALQMFKDLRARKMLITHWGTFRLGDDPVHRPPLDMLRVMQEAGLEEQLIQLQHGETLPLP